MSEVSFCQTVSFEASDFKYETVNHENGNATMIKFQIEKNTYGPGDVVVVLDGEEIVFHGVLGKIEDGEAYAYDPKGSLLPATVV
jgi:hypothetical protein